MPRLCLTALAATVVLLGVTGCAAAPIVAETPQSAVAEPAASPSPTETPDADPVEEGEEPSASEEISDDLERFSRVAAQVWGSEQRSSGRAYIDALVDAGFDRDAMQVTEDASTVGNAAESIQFSVWLGQDCLIGQVGPATGDPVTGVFEALPGERCLIGQTRTIDW